MLGPEIVQVTTDNVKVIRDRLKITQDRQRSYVDKRRRDLEFQVGDQVFMRISPWKGVLRFRKKGKLSPHYMGPYEIVERALEFKVGDHVFLKVMPKRGVIRFGKRGKLSSRYIGPFEVLKRVGAVAYRLALSQSLSSVHEAFHVSMLRKYTLDSTHIVDWGELVVDADGTFEEGPVRIMDS